MLRFRAVELAEGSLGILGPVLGTGLFAYSAQGNASCKDSYERHACVTIVTFGIGKRLLR